MFDHFVQEKNIVFAYHYGFLEDEYNLKYCNVKNIDQKKGTLNLFLICCFIVGKKMLDGLKYVFEQDCKEMYYLLVNQPKINIVLIREIY